MDAAEVDVEFANGRPASKLRMSITVGRNLTTHQFAKGGPAHWKGHMYIVIPVPRFPSIMFFYSLCPVSSSCTIVVSKERARLFQTKIATFSIPVSAVTKDDVTFPGNPT